MVEDVWWLTHFYEHPELPMLLKFFVNVVSNPNFEEDINNLLLRDSLIGLIGTSYLSTFTPSSAHSN